MSDILSLPVTDIEPSTWIHDVWMRATDVMSCWVRVSRCARDNVVVGKFRAAVATAERREALDGVTPDCRVR